MFTLAAPDLTHFISPTGIGVARVGDLPFLLTVWTASWGDGEKVFVPVTVHGNKLTSHQMGIVYTCECLCMCWWGGVGGGVKVCVLANLNNC